MFLAFPFMHPILEALQLKICFNWAGVPGSRFSIVLINVYFSMDIYGGGGARVLYKSTFAVSRKYGRREAHLECSALFLSK